MEIEISKETAHDLVATTKYELEGLLDTEPVEGFAAEDEIREAIDHLDAAQIDLQDAILNDDSGGKCSNCRETYEQGYSEQFCSDECESEFFKES